MSADNGGPAFPVAFVQGNDPHGADASSGNEGMTLLDWYAGQALAGLVSRLAYSGMYENAAEAAYKHADAMLAEKRRREATGKDSLQVDNHSGDANKMVELEEENRELVEALDELLGSSLDPDSPRAAAASKAAGALIAKHQASRGGAKGGVA